MITYLDTSAATKLVVEEAESAAMHRQITTAEPQMELVASALLETELRRTAERAGISQTKATQVLRRVNLVVPDRDFFHEAGLLPGRHLRSLDALHLITAIMTGAEVLLAYDHRLLGAAAAVGIPTMSPS